MVEFLVFRVSVEEVWAQGLGLRLSRAEELSGCMMWTETCFEFRVMLEFLRTQGLGLGSRLLWVVGLWLRSFRRRVWVQGCLGFRVWVEELQLYGLD